MVLEEIQLSCEDVIEVHFEAKGSYTQLSKFLSATKRKIPKSKFSFPSTTELNIYKRGLKVPTIKQFTNTTGKTIGRVCDFKEVLKFLFSNKDVVQNCNWFLSSPNFPCLLTPPWMYFQNNVLIKNGVASGITAFLQD